LIVSIRSSFAAFRFAIELPHPVASATDVTYADPAAFGLHKVAHCDAVLFGR
jgi:hypothetical protein